MLWNANVERFIATFIGADATSDEESLADSLRTITAADWGHVRPGIQQWLHHERVICLRTLMTSGASGASEDRAKGGNGLGRLISIATKERLLLAERTRRMQSTASAADRPDEGLWATLGTDWPFATREPRSYKSGGM